MIYWPWETSLGRLKPAKNTIFLSAIIRCLNQLQHYCSYRFNSRYGFNGRQSQQLLVLECLTSTITILDAAYCCNQSQARYRKINHCQASTLKYCQDTWEHYRWTILTIPLAKTEAEVFRVWTNYTICFNPPVIGEIGFCTEMKSGSRHIILNCNKH